MTDNELFVGFDTSNYTTSIAVADLEGNIVLNSKKPLPVKSGERGLRQSDAVFHHTDNLYCLLDGLQETVADRIIAAVGSSERPRDAEGSYMPCFLVGRDNAKSFAVGSQCDYYDFSHQAGHVMAALYSADKLELVDKEVIAFHISGGTTDVLYVKPSQTHVFDITQVGGSEDLKAGQLIDRMGVRMGMQFPCGPEIEKCALRCSKDFRIKPCVKDKFYCNLSGAENKALELYNNTNSVEETSAYVLSFIRETLTVISDNLVSEYNLPIVYAGGVASCSILKNALSRYGSFAEPAFSSDNAAGIALLARYKYLKQHNV